MRGILYFQSILLSGSVNIKNVEEFLSEATIMKDFHHENVLELIGVTIRGDVPFVLLPFMEYGDLRNYISNQNLVSIRICISIISTSISIS